MQENNAVEILYRDLVGEFSHYRSEGISTLRSLPHWSLPAPNLNTNTSSHIPPRSRFQFKVRRPRPFSLPSNVNPLNYWDGDPFDQMVIIKKKWESHRDYLIRRARQGHKFSAENDLDVNRVKKNDKKKHIYSVATHLDLVQHIEKDPYPAFSGNYNWFYTGGCITSCTVNGERFLLYPGGKNMDTLCVNQQQVAEDENQVCTSLSLCEGQRIHQIVENKGLVGIKQEKVCSLARIKYGSNKPLSAQTRLEIQEEEGFFVSVDLGRLEGKQMCTTNSKMQIKLWDLSTSSCLSTAKVPLSDNLSNASCWSFVKFNNKSPELFVLDRSTVFVKDLRMPFSENCMEFSPREIIDDCEEISLLLNSVGQQLVYVASTHKLLSLDVRSGWCQRWTHLMEAPPMYGSIYCDERNLEEVILLSSSIPDDSVAIVNSWRKGEPTSEILPRSFQSLKDTLILARSRGQCLGVSLKQRLDMATSGLTVVPTEDNDGFTAFKSTSIGDVFYQQFESDPSALDSTESAYSKDEIDADVEAWKRWSKANDVICSQNKVDLHCPVYSHDFLFNSIKKPMPKSRKYPYYKVVETWHQSFPEKKRRLLNKKNFPFERDSVPLRAILSDLSTYSDLMARILLNAWDSEGLYGEPQPAKNVEDWLNSIPVSSNASMDEDEFSLNRSLRSISPQPSFSGSLGSITPQPSFSRSVRSVTSQPLSLMSMLDRDDFKIPAPPSKKRKRESMGF
ncbi:uncharacterized protein LOC117649199 isoform X2 [Thrips palmi]|uniref:Uncharacterized protein LOC117649199 isoform X2 n=1 Tax=Thrips palmi TaxID=161013 RepID=A0A6P8ZDJ3_THRPL|nr:uncharacterized protein LOC117649199 isoform X2 [Thrips palmi]